VADPQNHRLEADQSWLEPPPRNLRLTWWLSGTIVLLLLFWFVFQLFGPSPPIVVSPQTTYITKPLRDDGLPDYEKHLLDQLRDGVTPENNAAVLLWQAMWPGGLKPEHQPLIARELGLKKLPSKQEVLVPFDDPAVRNPMIAWVQQQVASQAQQSGKAGDSDDHQEGSANVSLSSYEFFPSGHELLDQMIERRPWSSRQFPPVAAWVSANQRPLDLIVEASKRPNYYPPAPLLLNDRRDYLWDSWPAESYTLVPNAAQALSVRAMGRVWQGHLDEAWEDLLAIHRLARFFRRPGLDLHWREVGIDGVAHGGTVVLLGDDRLSADLARRIHQDLTALSAPSNLAGKFDNLARLFTLDVLFYVRANGIADWLSAGLDSGRTHSAYWSQASLDWNLILAETNCVCDQLAAAVSLPTRAARQQALAQVVADIERRRDAASTTMARLGGWFSRQQRSQQLAAIIASELWGAWMEL
jgi:hypothetical protein